MITLGIIIYFVVMFIVFFLLYYKSLKPSFNGKTYNSSEAPDSAFVAALWPFFLLIAIVISPFWLLSKIAKKLKKVNNPQNVNL